MVLRSAWRRLRHESKHSQRCVSLSMRFAWSPLFHFPSVLEDVLAAPG